MSEPKDKWEYIWRHIRTPSELNLFGNDGWELCYGHGSWDAFGKETQLCFFKRRK